MSRLHPVRAPVILAYLESLGFRQVPQKGSHHIFRKPGVRELINLQQEGSKAKV